MRCDESRCYVVHFVAPHISHACHCPSHLPWCSRSHFAHLYSHLSDLNQVFYGRYLKRLSNKTQEALGDMSKVRPPPYLKMEVLKVGFVGRPGSLSRPSHGTSFQRSTPRRKQIFSAGRSCPDTRSARSDRLGYILWKYWVEWKRRAFDFTRLWFVGPPLAGPRRIYLTVNFRRVPREQWTDISRRTHKPVDVYALCRQRPANVNVCPPHNALQ